MLLDRVVEGGLELDVLRVDVGARFEQELAERDGLDRVDQAGAAVVVGSLNVGGEPDEQPDDFEVCHEAG